MAGKDTGAKGLGEKRGQLLQSLQRSSRRLMVAGDELKKAERLDAGSAEKISHECRTLLNIVIGFTELMLDEVVGNINEKQRDSLNEILTSARRLENLVDIRVGHPQQSPARKK